MSDPFFRAPQRVTPLVAEPSSIAALRRRAEAILWIRTQMARYSLSVADLVAAGCFAPPARERAVRPASTARYGSADGQTWDGIGEMPDWLQRAVNAGQSVEHFRLGN